MSQQRLYWLPWWWYQWPRGWAFLPRDRVKTPAKISPLKGWKFSFFSTMTTKLYLHIIEETCIAQNHTFISKFLQVLLRYLTKTWKSGVFTPVYPMHCTSQVILKWCPVQPTKDKSANKIRYITFTLLLFVAWWFDVKNFSEWKKKHNPFDMKSISRWGLPIGADLIGSCSLQVAGCEIAGCGLWILWVAGCEFCRLQVVKLWSSAADFEFYRLRVVNFVGCGLWNCRLCIS